MADFERARTNMVDSQIHTMGVIDPKILNVFETLPRENFVPKAIRDVAYCDEDIHIGEGRYLLEPSIHARIIQLLDLKSSDIALDVGGGTGYSAAVLSQFVATVIAIEQKQSFLDQAQKLWAELEVVNVVGFKRSLHKGDPKHAPFDVIFVSGAFPEIPKFLIQQLSEGGRMALIIRKPGAAMGQVHLIRKLDQDNFSSHPVFDAACPYLDGFTPKRGFDF